MSKDKGKAVAMDVDETQPKFTRKKQIAKKPRTEEQGRLKDFISEERMLFFQGYYANNDIVQERGLDPKTVNPAFLASLTERGWGCFLNITKPVNATLAREFIANLDHTHLADGYVMVRGVEVSVSPEALNVAYGFPPKIAKTYEDEIRRLILAGIDWDEELVSKIAPRGGWHIVNNKKAHIMIGQFSEAAKAIIKFIYHNIWPKCKNARVTMEDLKLYYGLVNGCAFDLGAIWFGMLKQYPSDRKRAIILPRLLEKLCLDAGVKEYSSDVHIKPPKAITQIPEPTLPPIPEAPVDPIGPIPRPRFDMTPEEARQLHRDDEMRCWIRGQGDMLARLLQSQQLLHSGQHPTDESIFQPFRPSYLFSEDNEDRMAQVRADLHPPTPDYHSAEDEH